MSKIMQLSDIRIDGGTQSRERLCEDTVADYSEAMKAGDQFPPIVAWGTVRPVGPDGAA